MPRPRILPSDCPWASLVEAGLISKSQANNYRNGHAKPTPIAITHFRSIGYEVTIQDGRAVCERWPGMGGGGAE